jgi:hypothetical protein
MYRAQQHDISNEFLEFVLSSIILLVAGVNYFSVLW